MSPVNHLFWLFQEAKTADPLLEKADGRKYFQYKAAVAGYGKNSDRTDDFSSNSYLQTPQNLLTDTPHKSRAYPVPPPIQIAPVIS